MDNIAAYGAEMARAIIILVLLFSSLAKLKDFSDFSINLANSFHMGITLAKSASLLLILIEFIFAISMLTQKVNNQYLGYLLLTLFGLFTAVIALRLFQNKPFTCNCFGNSSQAVTVFDLYRNLLILVACCIYTVYQSDAIVLNSTEQTFVWGSAAIWFAIIKHSPAMLKLLSEPTPPAQGQQYE